MKHTMKHTTQIKQIRRSYERYLEVRTALRHGQATLQQLAKALADLDASVENVS